MQNSKKTNLTQTCYPNHLPSNTQQSSQKQIKVKQLIQIKIVLIGDQKVGKTSLIQTYIKDNFQQQYNPSILQTYPALTKYKNKVVQMNVWDWSGSKQYEHAREISFQNTDIFFICFSLVDMSSYYRAVNKWLPDLTHKVPQAIIIFVGTKYDIYEEQIQRIKKKPIKLRLDAMIAKIKQLGHKLVICSAGVQESVRQVFHEAMEQIISLRQKNKKNYQNKCNLI